MMKMIEIRRVVHDGRPCFWAPKMEGGIPIEGKGLFVAPSTIAGNIAMKITMESGKDTGWIALSEQGSKSLIRLLAEGLREFDGVIYVPEKKP